MIFEKIVLGVSQLKTLPVRSPWITPADHLMDSYIAWITVISYPSECRHASGRWVGQVQVAHQIRAYHGFIGMKRLGVPYLLDYSASTRSGAP